MPMAYLAGATSVPTVVNSPHEPHHRAFQQIPELFTSAFRLPNRPIGHVTLRMIRRMQTRERVTVTLPPDLLATAKAAAHGNLSAYVERAIRAQALREAADAVSRWRGDAGGDVEEISETFGEDIA